MPRLEQVIVLMVELFEQYAGEDGGKKKQISMDEIKNLLEKEVESPEIKDNIPPEEIKEAIEMLDKNHDGDVNFREYSRCVASLAKGYYKQKRAKAGKKGKKEEED